METEFLLHNKRITAQYIADYKDQFEKTADEVKKLVSILLDKGLEYAADYTASNPVLVYKKGDKVPQQYKSLGKLICSAIDSHAGKASVIEADKFIVFRKDNYHCRYTGIKLITHPLIELLSYILPLHFPYSNPPHGSDIGEKNTHLLVWVLWPSADHIVPVRRGGRNEMNNYITSSSKFNVFKGKSLNQDLGIEIKTIKDANWYGLEQEYLLLFEKYKHLIPLKRLKKFVSWNKAMS